MTFDFGSRSSGHFVGQTLVFLLLLFTTATDASAEPWQRHVIDNSFRGADGVRLGDFDGDGLMDVVTGWEESGVVRLYRNPGPTLARKPWPAVTIGEAGSPEDAVPVDLDGDGRLEVISCHEGSVKRVYIHRHLSGDLLDPDLWSSTPVSQVDGIRWMFAVPIRIGHSSPGLIIGAKDRGGSISLLLPGTANVSDPSSWKAKKLRDAGWIMSLITIDMDDDGDEDLVFSDRKGSKRGVGWLEQPDDPVTQEWPEHLVGATNHEPMFIDAAPDRIIVPTRNAVTLDFRLGDDGRWSELRIENPPGVPFGKAVKRLGADAIVLSSNTDANKGTNPKRPGMWIRNGNGPWEVIDPTSAVKLDRIECIDLDGDGDLDVMTCEERKNLGVIWFENPGYQ